MSPGAEGKNPEQNGLVSPCGGKGKRESGQKPRVWVDWGGFTESQVNKKYTKESIQSCERLTTPSIGGQDQRKGRGGGSMNELNGGFTGRPTDPEVENQR